MEGKRKIYDFTHNNRKLASFILFLFLILFSIGVILMHENDIKDLQRQILQFSNIESNKVLLLANLESQIQQNVNDIKDESNKLLSLANLVSKIEQNVKDIKDESYKVLLLANLESQIQQNVKDIKDESNKLLSLAILVSEIQQNVKDIKDESNKEPPLSGLVSQIKQSVEELKIQSNKVSPLVKDLDHLNKLVSQIQLNSDQVPHNNYIITEIQKRLNDLENNSIKILTDRVDKTEIDQAVLNNRIDNLVELKLDQQQMLTRLNIIEKVTDQVPQLKEAQGKIVEKIDSVLIVSLPDIKQNQEILAVNIQNNQTRFQEFKQKIEGDQIELKQQIENLKSSQTSTNSTCNSASTTPSNSNSSSNTSSNSVSSSPVQSIQLFGPYFPATHEQFIYLTQNEFRIFQTTTPTIFELKAKAIVTLIATGHGLCNSCQAIMTFMKNQEIPIPVSNYSNWRFGAQYVRTEWLPINLTQEFQLDAGTYDFSLGVTQIYSSGNVAQFQGLSFIVKITYIL